MRTSRTLDWKYIKNLATTIVGSRAISDLRTEHSGGNLKARPLYLYYEQMVSGKVREMSAETLGRIVAFACPRGYHYQCEDGNPPDFISLTGYEHMLPVATLAIDNGQSIMEKLATATIIATVRDIVMQSKWMQEWQNDAYFDHMMDQGAHFPWGASAV